MGHVPEDFAPLSRKGVPGYRYPGEEAELEFAKAHAIRLSPREFRTVTQKYQDHAKPLTRRKTGLRLRDVQGGELLPFRLCGVHGRVGPV